MAGLLFIASVVLGLLSLATLGFVAVRAVRNSSQVLVCRLLRGKITYVHRRLWPALVRLAHAFRRPDLAALREVHTARGAHTLRLVPFPRWVPAPVKRRARKLTEAKAWAALGLERPPGRPTVNGRGDR